MPVRQSADFGEWLDSVEDPARLGLLLRDLPTDSADEAMYLLHLLAMGATCSLIAPTRAAFVKHEVVDCVTGVRA